MNNPYDNGTGILSHELAKQLLAHSNVPIFFHEEGKENYTRTISATFCGGNFIESVNMVPPSAIFLNLPTVPQS